MALTDTAVRQAKPREKAYTVADGDGLALFVHPRSGKYWHFRYRVGGKAHRVSLGTYPEVSLRDARLRREEAWKIQRAGSDFAQRADTGNSPVPDHF